MSAKITLDKDTKQKLDDYRTSATLTGEQIVFKTFPKKLQDFVDSTSNPQSPFHLSNASHSTDATVYPTPSTTEPDSKKRKLDSGAVKNGVAACSSNDIQHAKHPGMMLSNKHMIAVHETLKRECEILVDLCDKVKLWINLSMPNGDNFGVQIQEDCLSELHRSQETALNLRDAARQDYLTRAKICTKVMKYPFVEDYALSLKEHDERQLFMARQQLHDLRSVYAVLTDILHKNIDKIRSPKGNNSGTMY
ncbi:proteasome activator pa28 REG alpha/beta subunit [Epithele typhae]|uniref:proteasome activator pa28 REG alpha/beta subunit n=1 Tax=Epithele typhae TaxID=378194 RepID=UPI002007E77E|nr:proteasome activator pa28 REG alpha/beta subunit [Epithele typhae]KAH9913337.1 proteasome activator pa28 REG alpha/beta subunit [Epithele typhae]